MAGSFVVADPKQGYLLPAFLMSHFWPNCDGRDFGLSLGSWPNCGEFWRAFVTLVDRRCQHRAPMAEW